MASILHKEEIKKRLVRLRNLEMLYEAQRFKIWNLRDENRALKKEVSLLKAMVAEQQKTINDLKLQIEELRTIVFGSKRRKDDHDNDISFASIKASEPRQKESYQTCAKHPRSLSDCL